MARRTGCVACPISPALGRGRPMWEKCVSCGEGLFAGDAFCGNCGRPTTPAVPAARGPERGQSAQPDTAAEPIPPAVPAEPDGPPQLELGLGLVPTLGTPAGSAPAAADALAARDWVAAAADPMLVPAAAGPGTPSTGTPSTGTPSTGTASPGTASNGQLAPAPDGAAAQTRQATRPRHAGHGPAWNGRRNGSGHGSRRPGRSGRDARSGGGSRRPGRTGWDAPSGGGSRRRGRSGRAARPDHGSR